MAEKDVNSYEFCLVLIRFDKFLHKPAKKKRNEKLNLCSQTHVGKLNVALTSVPYTLQNVTHTTWFLWFVLKTNLYDSKKQKPLLAVLGIGKYVYNEKFMVE